MNEHRSALRPGRVYVRKFDHDEARRLLSLGWTRREVADHLGVSQSRVYQISTPVAIAAAARRSREWKLAICDDCGLECTHNWSSKTGRHDRVVCRSCSNQRRSEDRLLERMNVDGDILCNDCGEHRPPADYPPRTSGAPRSYCRSCESARRKAYRDAHADADSAYQRDYRRRRRAKDAS